MEKKIILLIISLVVVSATLLAQINIAILPYETMDSKCKTLKTQFEKIDIKKTFGADEGFNLINQKQVAKATKKAIGKKKIYELDKSIIIGLGQQLGADIVLTGTITSTGSDFALSSKAYNVVSQSIKSIPLKVTKVSKDRRVLINSDLIPKIKEFFETESVKALDIAKQNYEAGKLDLAKNNFEDLHKKAPKNYEVIFYLSQIAFEQKDYVKCEEWARKGHELEPNDEPIAKLLAGSLRQLERYDDAAAILGPIAEKNSNASLWYYIGNMYKSANNAESAKEALHKAIELDNSHSQSNFLLGLIYVSEDDYESALPYLEVASMAHPEDELLAKNLGRAYRETGNLLKSIEHQEEVLKTEPNNYDLYYRLNKAYLSAADESTDDEQTKALYAKAVEILERLEALDSSNELLYITFAHTYNTINELKKAEASANKAIEMNASNVAPYMILAQIYFQKGTNEYNKFTDLELEFADAVGKKADDLKVQKDNAQKKTVSLFTQSKNYYNDALKNADPMREDSIKNSIKEVENYIRITSKN